MSESISLPTAANFSAKPYIDTVQGKISGGYLVLYDANDLFAPSINALLGTSLLPSPKTLSKNFAGMHLQESHVGRVNFGIARNHDMLAKWWDINPSRYTFVDAGLGNWFSACKAKGAETVFTLYGTPTWASARPTESDELYGRLGSRAEPADMAYLAEVITWIVTTYGDKIDYIEVWNEPAYSAAAGSFFTGTTAKMAEMYRVASQTVKAINPKIKILGWADGSLSASDNSTGTGKLWVDGIVWHGYYSDPPGYISEIYTNGKPDYEAARDAAGLPANFPMYCTEFGHLKFSSKTGPKQARMNQIFRMFLWMIVVGCERAIWYSYKSAVLGWGTNDAEYDFMWNKIVSTLNGATVSVINRIKGTDQLAATINGINYLV